MKTAYGQAVVNGSTIVGVEAHRVEVQVDVASGLPSFSIVGLADTAILEARERTRAAIRSSGYRFPSARVVVNLAPAPLRKHGAGLDLPIAVGILAATSQFEISDARKRIYVGELALDGRVCVVPGMLAHASRARQDGSILIGPTDVADAADSMHTHFGVLERLRDLDKPVSEVRPSRQQSFDRQQADIAEVSGHHSAKRAMEIAATGNHNLLMIGPPGSGKSMLARRLPSILPPLSDTERLESGVIHSIAGLDDGRTLSGVRPFRAPHHSVTTPGLIGGGRPPRPGEISLAHNGVLFLDEMAQFAPSTLQALRQPMEEGFVTVVRADGVYRFPSKFSLVGASNPCPCGYLGDLDHACRCPPGIIDRYSLRIGGPLLDRMDMRIRVARVDPDLILGPSDDEVSSVVRKRVMAARAFAEDSDRTDEPTGISGSALVKYALMSNSARKALNALARSSNLSGRSLSKIIRVSRTIADLETSDEIEEAHIDEAIMYRDSET